MKFYLFIKMKVIPTLLRVFLVDLQIILVFSTIDVATNHDIDHGKLLSPPYLGGFTKNVYVFGRPK